MAKSTGVGKSTGVARSSSGAAWPSGLAKSGSAQSPVTSQRATTTSLPTTTQKPNLVFIGDAIHGQEAQLLDRMIEAMGVARAEVSILAPEAAAMQEAGASRIFVVLGEKATQLVLGSEEPFANLRSRFHDYRGSKLISVFHPSELLKNPLLKKDVWQDLQKVVKEMGIELPSKIPVKN